MTHAELGKLLGLPKSTVTRLLKQGRIRQEGGVWIVERPKPGRAKGQYGKGLKWEKGS